MAFPPVYARVKTIAEFITHVQYVVETCPATYFVGNLNSDIGLTFPKNSGKHSLHFLKLQVAKTIFWNF